MYQAAKVLSLASRPTRDAERSVIAELTGEIRRISRDKIADIDMINREATYLAINALIEAARAGEAGRGFAVVAKQVKDVSGRIGRLTGELDTELSALSERMVSELERQQGQRLGDLALNMIDIIDRNLYERSCDVRWWATDTAAVDCLAVPSPEAAAHAAKAAVGHPRQLHRVSRYLDPGSQRAGHSEREARCLPGCGGA